MDRIVGLETEYGCLVSGEKAAGNGAWPARVRNHLFREMEVGALDLHFRDYEEPPGNGGFLRNGGRIYLDMGHLEYASPECLSLHDAVTYDQAGDEILQSALDSLGVSERVAFIKNNVDHHTGATFGCHENYLMSRQAQFTPSALGTLLAFLATRQIFTGAGRVGKAQTIEFESAQVATEGQVDFQISQRADHIVNDIYQWVQFNRAIINARDEPLADYRKYRRLHLLIGDSNMSPFANALKLGTTACILTLLEENGLTSDLTLLDAVVATREISQDATERWLVQMENGETRSALDLQWQFHEMARAHLAGRDAETDWILESWSFTLKALARDRMALVGGVDWMTKKWLLETFRESENLSWDDPWLLSLDLEYHNIDPTRGLFFSVATSGRIAEWNHAARRTEAQTNPPADTRAAGRGLAVREFQKGARPYVIDWDAIARDENELLRMSDPFLTYTEEVTAFLRE